MDEYILKTAAMEIVRRTSGDYAAAFAAIRKLPAADVAPVVYGKWAPSERNPSFLVCSVCGDCYVVDEWAGGKKWMYCPACGAKMDKEDKDDV